MQQKPVEVEFMSQGVEESVLFQDSSLSHFKLRLAIILYFWMHIHKGSSLNF